MKSNKWIGHLALTNIKKHRKRNIFSILSLVVGLTASFLIIGFSMNAENSIRDECYKQIDYGNLTISKENKTESTNGGLSIVRNSRPTYAELSRVNLNEYEIDINLSSLVPSFCKVSYGKEELKDFTYQYVYSFFDNYFDKSLLLEGNIPNNDGLEFVLVNEKMNSEFRKKYKSSPIGKTINIYNECSYSYFTGDDYQPVIDDYFIYDKNVVVTGVVKDLAFLSTPKIYYSYLGLRDYLSYIYLNNLSEYFSADYSWIDRISDSNPSDDINSYSYCLFLKDYKNVPKVSEFIDSVKMPLTIDCPSMTRTEALLGLIKAATTGMELFLVITLLGTALIMGIVSFSYYSEDKKTIAILSCLGAKMDDINDIYCTENIMIALIAFLVSVISAPILQLLINYIIEKSAGFKGMVSIPFLKFLNIPFGLPLVVFVGTIFVASISTIIPIMFSKKISLKEELKDE